MDKNIESKITSKPTRKPATRAFVAEPKKLAPMEDPAFLAATAKTLVPRSDVVPRSMYTVSDLVELLHLLEREGLGDCPVLISTDDMERDGSPIKNWSVDKFNARERGTPWYTLESFSGVQSAVPGYSTIKECVVLRTVG